MPDNIYNGNDETKLLEGIYIAYRAFCGDGRVLTEFEQSIMKKLKAIIDKYCEHKVLVTDNDSGHGHNWTNKCKKCGKVIR